MFDMFTSRNVKKIFKYSLSRPTTMSDQIVGVRECGLSNLSVDTLGVYCIQFIMGPNRLLIYGRIDLGRNDLKPIKGYKI